MDTLFACNRFGLEANEDAWKLQTELLNFLEHIWGKLIWAVGAGGAAANRSNSPFPR